MKIITIFLLLIISLFADNNRTLPDGIILDNAKKVATEGWNSADEPLKKVLKKDGATFINVFLKSAGKLYKIDTKRFSDLTPKKKDYYYAMAYAKYLESQKKIDEALNIYMKSLKGLVNSQSKSAGMLRLLYSLIIENIIIKSLKKSVEQNIYNENEKKRLYVFLKDNLLLNEEVFLAALDDDRYDTFKLCLGRDFGNDKLSLAFCGKLNQKLERFNEKVYQISNKEEYEKLFSDLDENRINFYKNNQKRLYELDDRTYQTLPEDDISIIIENLFYSITIGIVGEAKLDLIKRIEENKELLKNWQS